MKTKKREIVIKSIEQHTSYFQNGNKFFVYEIETKQELNLNTIDTVIVENTKKFESFTEFMEENNISFEQTLEFLNNNYKKQ